MTMKTSEVFLVLSMSGGRLKVDRMTKSRPGLYREELAVKVRVQVDDEVFRTKIPEATLVLEGNDLLAAEFDPTVEALEATEDDPDDEASMDASEGSTS